MPASASTEVGQVFVDGLLAARKLVLHRADERVHLQVRGGAGRMRADPLGGLEGVAVRRPLAKRRPDLPAQTSPGRRAPAARPRCGGRPCWAPGGTTAAPCAPHCTRCSTASACAVACRSTSESVSGTTRRSAIRSAASKHSPICGGRSITTRSWRRRCADDPAGPQRIAGRARERQREKMQPLRRPVAQPCRGRPLRVGVDQSDRARPLGQTAGEVHGYGALAGAALEVADGDDLAHQDALPQRTLVMGHAWRSVVNIGLRSRRRATRD